MKSLLVGKEQGALTLCRFILQLVSAGLTTFTLLLLHEVPAAVLRWNRWTDRELEEEKGSGGGGKAIPIGPHFVWEPHIIHGQN